MVGEGSLELADILRRLSQLTVGPAYEADLAAALADAVLAVSGYERALVLASGSAQRPTAIANRNVDADYVRFVLEHYAALPGHGALQSGQTLVAEDVTSMSAYASILPQMEKAHIRSLVVFPMRVLDQELMGALIIYHKERGRPSDEVMTRAQAVVAHATLLLGMARLSSTRKELLEQAALEKNQDVVAVMAAGIAHDFNNLLGGILGLITLAPRLGKVELENLTAELGRSVERASQLSRNLLALARGGASTNEPAEVAELVSTIRSAVTMARVGRPSDAAVVFQPEPTAAWARVTPVAASRILLNLLLNALEAIGPAANGRVTLRLRPTATTWDIEVDDNGPGIPAGQRERIFEPFVSVGKPGGSGVGLAAARGLATRAGGTLTLRHRDGAGACFVLSVPRVLEPNGEHAAGQDAKGAAEGTKARAPRRLLLAEDEPVQQRVFAQALREAGFAVDVVTDGEAARDALRQIDYAAALIDHTMPRLSGGSLLSALRAGGSTLPVVLVTGFADDPRLKAMTSDALTRMVSKPVRADALVAVVEEVLRSAAGARRS